METCDTTDDDAAALKARRERLRAVAIQIAEVVETIPLPHTFLEAERAARTVTIADRMILRLPPDEPEAVKPARQRLRIFGDRLLDTIERLTLPDTFLGAERAGRCVLATDHMLAQLYEAPKLPKQPAFADDIDDHTEQADTLSCKNIHLVRRHAL